MYKELNTLGLDDKLAALALFLGSLALSVLLVSLQLPSLSS